MRNKDSLQMLTPPVSGRIWVQSAVASLMSTAIGIAFLARGEWIPAVILIAAGLVALTGQVPQLLRLYRERSGPSPPRGGRQ